MQYLALIGIDILSTLWEGLVLKVLWGWFFVTIFGLPNITIATAVGISIVIGFLTNQYIQRDEEALVELAIYKLFNPLFALVMGFIAHQFV